MLMLHILMHILSDTCTQCRPIAYYESLEEHICGPYLSNKTLYYNPNTWQSDYEVKNALAILQPVLSSHCLSNLVLLACQARFRECREVSHDSAWGSVMLPSLMVREARVIHPFATPTETYSLIMQCRSECEKHVDIWKRCVDEIEIEQTAEERARFNTIRQQTVCYL
jgi:hypothetical protein